MNAIRTILTLAAAAAVLCATGCTGGERSSSLTDIEQSFATLVELFKAPEPDMQAYAATTESFAQNPEAIKFLEKKAKSMDEDERAVSADVLGASQDKKAVFTLASMVRDESIKTRGRVYVALQRHDTHEAREALADAMRIHGPESGLAEAVCEVMDAELWATTSKIIIKSTRAGADIAFDPEMIHSLIARAREHEFDADEFDSEEFELRMAEFTKEMEARFGEDNGEFEWDDED